MKNFFLMAVLLGPGVFAFEFFSRNMPLSCEYVFFVESDLMWVFEIAEAKDGDLIRTELFNEYTEEWVAGPELKIAFSEGKLKGEYSFSSMSTNPRFLFRKIRFQKANQTFESEFGREFGEKCYSGGRSETPFKKRAVTEI